VGADAVECLLLSARSLPFNVPKGGVLNADGNLTPLTRDVPAKSKDDPQPSSPRAPATESSTTPQDGDAWRGDELVIHFHGGGFVSGSPYTHGTL
jgi:acetyl esterase/lipase